LDVGVCSTSNDAQSTTRAGSEMGLTDCSQCGADVSHTSVAWEHIAIDSGGSQASAVVPCGQLWPCGMSAVAF
jgi:hypothetical protein